MQLSRKRLMPEAFTASASLCLFIVSSKCASSWPFLNASFVQNPNIALSVFGEQITSCECQFSSAIVAEPVSPVYQ